MSDAVYAENVDIHALNRRAIKSEQRVEKLEKEVAELKRELERLVRRVGSPGVTHG